MRVMTTDTTAESRELERLRDSLTPGGRMLILATDQSTATRVHRTEP